MIVEWECVETNNKASLVHLQYITFISTLGFSRHRNSTTQTNKHNISIIMIGIELNIKKQDSSDLDKQQRSLLQESVSEM